MPKRTNEFQRLIFAIEAALSDGDAELVESAMKTDRTTNEGREVDFVITQRFGPRLLRVGVECRDHKRRQSVEWIEQLVTKRNDLGLDRMVAVSSRGFTPAAISKAQAHGIEAQSLTKAISTDWRSAFDKLGFMHQGVTRGSVVAVTATDPQGSENPISLGREPLLKTEIYDLTGNVLGTLHSVANAMPLYEPIRAYVEQTGILDAPVRVNVIVDYQNGAHLVDISGTPHTFVALRFTVDMTRTESKIPVELGDYGSARVAVAKTKVKEFRFAFTGVQPRGQDARFSLVPLPPERG